MIASIGPASITFPVLCLSGTEEDIEEDNLSGEQEKRDQVPCHLPRGTEIGSVPFYLLER